MQNRTSISPDLFPADISLTFLPKFLKFLDLFPVIRYFLTHRNSVKLHNLKNNLTLKQQQLKSSIVTITTFRVLFIKELL